MIQRKVDRRVSRTRRRLKDALFSLILEKGYDSVTIEDITERADLGRTTFYLHYRDKEDLLRESIDAITQELLEQVAVGPSSGTGSQADSDANITPLMPVLIVFEHSAENADLYRIVLRGEGAWQANERLRNIISIAITQLLSARAASEGQELRLDVPLEVFSQFFAGSLLGLLTWWLEHDMPYSPDEMTRIFQRLALRGARDVFGPD